MKNSEKQTESIIVFSDAKIGKVPSLIWRIGYTSSFDHVYFTISILATKVYEFNDDQFRLWSIASGLLSLLFLENYKHCLKPFLPLQRGALVYFQMLEVIIQELFISHIQVFIIAHLGLDILVLVFCIWYLRLRVLW